jgi:hypothetical protein
MVELQDSWRARLAEAAREFTENRSSETRQNYLRVLQIFTDLVSRGRRPMEV